MKLRVALTTTDLSSLEHKQALLSSPSGLVVKIEGAQAKTVNLAPGQKLKVTVKGESLEVQTTGSGAHFTASRVTLAPAKGGHSIFVDSLKRARAKGQEGAEYRGYELNIALSGGHLRLVLVLDLEQYLKGVLESEIPASYHLEALKAQAVAARTYALNPRISHEKDNADVCDSYLCCQYFAGHKAVGSAKHTQAIESTSGEILKYGDKAILALFSSNAGGYTSNYEDCFSDPKTNLFPPAPIPYLRAVVEKQQAAAVAPKLAAKDMEAQLKEMWHNPQRSTFDSWSPHFKWSVHMPAQALEAHMHHELSLLAKDKDTAPFVIPPQGGQFGHIQKFEVTERGISGVAIQLAIHTSTGQWLVKKELVIRSAFKNSEIKLARLKSAKILFEHQHDRLGLLSSVTVRGLGWGHGVGLQQTGAQGMALLGKQYREILAHYFTNTQIHKIGS
ncbi:MAG: hypothetical protein C0469_15575 [Cyanobacteria bacterium DS2.3.42]|nr:hypothetical protein [Cyanobacteria bacterium DS2.3.42]